MNSQKHIIRTQTITVEMAAGNSVVAVQDKVKHLYYNKILPQLDTLFSGLATGETIIRIDKLEVDAGNIYKDEFEQLFVERTLTSVEKQLKEQLKFDVKTNPDINIASTLQSAIEELVYFLSHGYFSWRNRDKKIETIEDVILSADVKNIAAFTNTFTTLFTEKPYVIKRLVNSFSDRFLQHIAFVFAPKFPSSECFEIIKASFTDQSSSTHKNEIRIFFWKDVFTNMGLIKSGIELQISLHSLQFAASNQNISFDELLQSIDKEKLSASAVNLLKKITQKQTDSSVQDEFDNALKTGIIKGEKDAFVNDDISKKNTADLYPTKQDHTTNNKTLPDDEVSGSLKKQDVLLPETDAFLNEKKKQFSKQKESIVTDEPIYLELAGLVILHSFLNSFFDALRLTKDKRFCNEASLHKAVQLTGHLAAGETRIEEHYLVLPKLLCGIDFTEPIENNILISDEEKEEANALLQQVIKYWPALKNTSVEGLRNSFLKREGKLTRAGLGWQLDIEHKTWDILLSKLSWGFSLIKLPWMKEFLFVNWA